MSSLLGFAAFMGFVLLAYNVFKGVDTKSSAATAILSNPKYRWTDSLKAWGGQIHFDQQGGFLGVLSRSSPPQVIAFGDVRE